MHVIFIFGSLNLDFPIKWQLALGKLVFSGLQREKTTGQMRRVYFLSTNLHSSSAAN